MVFHPVQSRKSGFFLLIILLVALGLRLYKLDAYGIFFDEKSTVLISQGISLEGANQQDVFGKKYFTPREFWKPKPLQDYFDAHIRGDIGNSPAYYLLIHGWIRLFGLSDFSVRLLSVLFSVATVWLLYRFTLRHLGNARLALAAAALAAIEPFFVAYSHQARNYSMSFFFTLLATHLFLKLVKTPASERRVSQYVAYGLTAMVCLFCHYLAFTVLLAHGLYVLSFVKPGRVWVGLAAAVGVAGLGMALWMTYGGGTYTLRTLKYQARFYHDIAHNPAVQSRYAGWIDPATPANVIRKLGPILADQFIVSNGFYGALKGAKNFALLGLLTVLSVWCYRRWRRGHEVLYPILALGANAAALTIFSVAPGRFLALEAAVVLALLLGLFFVKKAPPDQRRLLLFFLILSVLPTGFLLFSALKDGHTVGLTQRYAGFSFPYAILLVVLALREAAELDKWARYAIFGALLWQLGCVVGVLNEIYRDTSVKYTYFGKPRLPNPYWRAAKTIEALYQPGDTVIYPANNRSVFSAVKEEQKQYERVSPFDAQMVNLYLPKTADYPQRIDPTNGDKIWLYQHRTNQRRLIVDLKGLTYRY
jgi:4-amino-4-deoxy-L-arabinose transferase-like glycosyltransferase